MNTDTVVNIAPHYHHHQHQHEHDVEPPNARSKLLVLMLVGFISVLAQLSFDLSSSHAHSSSLSSSPFLFVNADVADTINATADAVKQQTTAVGEKGASLASNLKETAQHVVDSIPIVSSILGSKDEKSFSSSGISSVAEVAKEELETLRQELNDAKNKLKELTQTRPSSTSTFSSMSLSRWLGLGSGRDKDPDLHSVIDHFGNEFDKLHRHLNSHYDWVKNKIELLHQLLDKQVALMHDTTSATQTIMARENTNLHLLNAMQASQRQSIDLIDKVYDLLQENHASSGRVQSLLAQFSHLSDAARERAGDSMSSLRSSMPSMSSMPSPIEKAKEFMEQAQEKTADLFDRSKHAVYSTRDAAQSSLEKMMHDLQQINSKLMEEMRGLKEAPSRVIPSIDIDGVKQSIQSTYHDSKTTMWEILTSPYRAIYRFFESVFQHLLHPQHELRDIYDNASEMVQHVVNFQTLRDLGLILTSLFLFSISMLPLFFVSLYLIKCAANRLRRHYESQRLPTPAAVTSIEQKASHIIDETVPQQLRQTTHTLHLDDMAHRVSQQAQHVQQSGIVRLPIRLVTNFFNFIIGTWRGTCQAVKDAFAAADTTHKPLRQQQLHVTREGGGGGGAAAAATTTTTTTTTTSGGGARGGGAGSGEASGAGAGVEAEGQSEDMEERERRELEQTIRLRVQEGIERMKQAKQQAAAKASQFQHSAQQATQPVVDTVKGFTPSSATSTQPSSSTSSSSSTSTTPSSISTSFPPKDPSATTTDPQDKQAPHLSHTLQKQLQQQPGRDTKELGDLFPDHPSKDITSTTVTSTTNQPPSFKFQQAAPHQKA